MARIDFHACSGDLDFYWRRPSGFHLFSCVFLDLDLEESKKMTSWYLNQEVHDNFIEIVWPFQY